MKYIFNPLSQKFDAIENDHTKLSNIGTNTHAQIDTALGTTIPATYLPLAGGTMVGNILMTGNKLIGGSTPTSALYLQTTTGVGTTGADMHFLVGNNGATEAMTILNGGNVGIGTTASTARLHLPACTAIANTASLKIDAGILAIIPVSGNIESDGIHLYWTDSVMGIRHQLDNQI